MDRAVGVALEAPRQLAVDPAAPILVGAGIHLPLDEGRKPLGENVHRASDTISIGGGHGSLHQVEAPRRTLNARTRTRSGVTTT